MNNSAVPGFRKLVGVAIQSRETYNTQELRIHPDCTGGEWLMKVVDMTAAIRRYHGQFVALSGDRRRVVASGRTPEAALLAAKKKGAKQPVLTRIPEDNRSYLL